MTLQPGSGYNLGVSSGKKRAKAPSATVTISD
jgi:hypothetical protein